MGRQSSVELPPYGGRLVSWERRVQHDKRDLSIIFPPEVHRAIQCEGTVGEPQIKVETQSATLERLQVRVYPRVCGGTPPGPCRRRGQLEFFPGFGTDSQVHLEAWPSK